MSLALRAEGLGKRYRIGTAEVHTGNRKRISHLLTTPIRNLERLRRLALFREQDEADIIWALRDVSFELKQGEVLGIVGHNGAGKSTLLKVLSRITAPSKGTVEIVGRVGSLLEVGTGFHPELSGRENIFLNGSILGMDRSYIRRRFDEIVQFAGVEKFIDTPVKRYSSGMYLRLAFAVAAHLEPEILIVDEVLAVGDAAFQRKCIGKMGEVASEGRTVLFVSHNLNAIESLCTRAILLEDGMVTRDGSPHGVVSDYLHATAMVDNDRVWEEPKTAPGNERVRLHRATARPREGTARDLMRIDTDLVLEFEYWNLVPSSPLSVTLHVRTLEGILAFTAASDVVPARPAGDDAVGLNRHVCHIPGGLLNDEGYRIEFLVVDADANLVYKHPDLINFDVHNSVDQSAVWHGKWGGVVRPALRWTTDCVVEAPSLAHAGVARNST